MLAEIDPPPNACKASASLKATVVLADGGRVRMTLDNSNLLAAIYHINQVYPGHQSHQLIVTRRAVVRPTC